MSAGPSHAQAGPSHAPTAAPHASNNAMHFNNGGVLGLTESLGRLIKGVTYDAAMDTFAHPAGAAAANNAEHHPPTALHATPAAGAAAPAVDAHGHPIVAAAGAAATVAAAAAAGHDDDDDDSIAGSIIKGLSHMGHYGAAFPVLAQGLKWAKNKMFPEIHEIATEDQHVGDQILHKLKKNKKNKAELDHHALDGFCKGLDISNLNRTFRMFTDPARFKAAVDREAGREEIKKEIANLFDISGDVDTAEATQITKLLKDLLHIHGHLHHGEWVIDTTHVDSRVRAQFTVLAKVILNAEEWLKGDGVLEKIYTGKSEKFEIDYDHFGDVLFEKVNKDNRKGFLKAFNKRSFDNAFGLLVKESEMKEAIKHDPDHIKDQIYKLFDCAGKVEADDLKNRFDEYFGKEATVGTAPTPAIEGILGEEPADDEGKKKYKELKGAIEEIIKNITNTKALDALFHSVTPLNLGEFGKSLDKVKDKDELTKFLKGFDIHRFKKNFRFILDGDRLDKIVQGDEVQRRGAQTQLLALLGYDNGPLDEAEMTAVIGGFRSTLTTLEPTIDASLKGDAKPYDQLLEVLTAIESVLKAKDRVRKVFEGAELEATPNHNAIGKQILGEIGKDKKKQIPFLKNLNVAVYTAKVSILTSDALDMLIDSPPEIPKIKEAITNLFGIEGPGPVHPHDIATGIEAMKAALQNPKLAYDPEAKASYDAFEALLKKVNKNLSGPRLKKIYS